TLYRINLQTGSATPVGKIGNGQANVDSLVVLPPSANFASVGATVTAGSGQALSIVATLSEPSQGTVTVPFTVSGTASPSDFSLSGNAFVFPPGTTTQTVTLTPTGPGFVGDRTAVLTQGTPTNALVGGQSRDTITLLGRYPAILQFSSPTYSVA